MNQAKYDGLSDAFKAAIDAHSGRGLSQLGEEAWNAAAASTIRKLRDSGDNTVIDLNQDEIAAFGALTLPVADKVISDLKGEDVMAVMRGE
jgi:TRAP-type C4-dicarboxylate transport system substrate-binding protein